MSYQFGTELKQVQDRINQFLANQFEGIDSYNAPLRDAMKYGLLLGGKRVRPFLVYATGKMLGAEMPALDYAAAAIESIHAYSLIHDDLPAMEEGMDKAVKGVELILSRGVAEAANRVNQKPKSMKKQKALQEQAEKAEKETEKTTDGVNKE